MASDSNNKHILVTGSHRSGSTWVGNVMAAAARTSYIHEPFNIGIHPSSPIRHWFEYIHPLTDVAYQKEVQQYITDFLRHKYHLLPFDILSSGSIAQAKLLIKKRTRQLMAHRQIIKDPIALMSAAWVSQHFCKNVIVLIHHPTAFAGQIQSLTLEDHDIIDQACLLWNCFHHVIIHYQQKHPEWIFVRHEDLSTNPLKEFKAIFAQLGLPFDKEVHNYLTQSVKMVESTGQNISAWKNRLSKEEITRVKENTKTIADKFYTEDEW